MWDAPREKPRLIHRNGGRTKKSHTTLQMDSVSWHIFKYAPFVTCVMNEYFSQNA